MDMKRHANATTTPPIRALIQASSQPGTVLARRFGVGMETIARWRPRDSVQDRPHTARRLQTTLSPGQEAMVVCLRRFGRDVTAILQPSGIDVAAPLTASAPCAACRPRAA